MHPWCMQHVVYAPAERPLVEVLIGDDWCDGDLRMWIQDDTGNWSAQVSWRRNIGDSARIDTVPAVRVRPAPEPDPATTR